MTEQIHYGGTSTAMSLTEAIADGQGIERPFRCPVHPDTHASASVNVLKGVWNCYACPAKGKVDSKAVPTEAELLAMLNPEKATRAYPENWLEWFGAGYYWLDRFPMWVARMLHLGEDPMTGEATFPVRTPLGVLAGVGRRTPQLAGARYMYPRDWSASRSLFGYDQVVTMPHDVIAIVEGAADGAAVLEVGCPALSCYGAGLHLPQRELIARLAPKLILMAYDADDAGRRATEATIEGYHDLAQLEIIDWSLGGAKDPAELDPPTRREILTAAVSRARYGSFQDVTATWAQAVQANVSRYSKDAAHA